MYQYSDTNHTNPKFKSSFDSSSSDSKFALTSLHDEITNKRIFTSEEDKENKRKKKKKKNNKERDIEIEKYGYEVRYLIPPLKPKPLSPYDRFKDVYFREAKKGGDSDEVRNISIISREEWELIKDIDVDLPTTLSSFSTNVKEGYDLSHLLHLKYLATKMESVETEKYQYSLHQFCVRYNKASNLYLRWYNSNITDQNEKDLDQVIKLIECKTKDWDNSVQKDYLTSIKISKQSLTLRKNPSRKIQALANKLRIASEEELIDHCREYCKAIKLNEEFALVKSRYDYLLAADL